jgi:hypothetical protein
MSNRADRREKLRQRMQQDAANRDKGGSKQRLFDFSEYEEVHFFKAKKGKNEIDILPFEVTTDNDPTGAGIGEDNYKLEYWQHNNIGPKEDRVLCLQETYSKPCPICETKKQMLDAGADWKDDEVKALTAKRRCIYNIIDLNDTEKGVQLFEQSHFKFEKELFGAAEYKDPAFICFADIEEGYTVSFRGSEETFNKNKFIEPKDFDFESRDPYNEDIYEDVFPLDKMLIIPTYEQVEALFLGVDTDDEKEEKPAPKKEKVATRKPKGTDRITAKVGREEPTRGRKSKPAPESVVDDHADDLPDCYVGHTYGEDWDNTSDCDDCPHFDPCGDRYEEMEKEKEEAKKIEKPTTRRRPKRR